MTDTAVADPVLSRLKRELASLYGPRLKQMLLYGSRARGTHGDDSDYDVLVVLESPLDWWTEVQKLGEISGRIGLDTAGAAILSLRPVTAEQLQERTGFMHNVRREARPL
jgi:uncharacterized protein